MSTFLCGVKCTPSTATFTPTSCAAVVMETTSGIEPITFDEPVTAIHFVRELIKLITDSASSLPVLESNSAIRIVDPESRAANIQGATFAS